MAGLDNIKHYDEGGDVESTDTTEAKAPLSAKAVESKSKYALPTTKGVGGVDENLLQNMRQLIAEREAQASSPLEGLKDATAWWSGGMAGPAATLAARDAQREAQTATTFGMKRDLAQYQVAQQQAQNLQRQLFGAPAATAPGQAAQPGGAAAPAAGAPSTQGGLLGLVRDPALQQSIAVQAQTDQPGALKSIQGYLAKNAEDPQLAKDIRWMVSNGLIDPKLVPAAAMTKLVGSGAFVPHDVRGVGGTGQGTPFGAAMGVSQGASPAAIAGAPAAPAAPAPAPAPVMRSPAPAVQPPAAAPAPTPAAAPAPAPAPAAAPAPAPAPTVLPGEPARVTPRITPVPRLDTTIPEQTPRVASPFAPGTKEDLEFQKSAAEVPLAGGKEFAQGVEKLNATKAAQVDTAAQSAGERKVRFNDIKAITEDPEMQVIFGKLAKKGITPFVLKQLESGVNAGQFGTMGVGNLERNLMEAGATKEQIEKLHKVEKSLGAAELDYAKTYLTGQGAVSDNERKLVKDAVGSVKDPAKVLNMQASVMAERAEFDEKVASLYDAYRERHGEYASFGKFMRSPGAKAAISEHNTKLAQIIGRKPNELGDPFNSKGGQQAPAASEHPGKSLVNQYLKR